MKNFLSLIILIFAITYANSQTADSIISKAIDALGGENAFKNINTIEFNMTLTVTGMGIDVSIKYFKKGDDKIRVEGKTEDEDKICALNGKTGWAWDNISEEFVEADEDYLDMIKKQYEYHFGFFNLYHYINKEKNITFKLKGEEQVNGIDTYEIEVNNSDIDYTLYIDKVTYLIVKARYVGYFHQHADKYSFNQQVFSDLYFSDYKSIGLIKMPHKVEQKISEPSGSIINYVLNNMKINENIDDSLFQKP